MVPMLAKMSIRFHSKSSEYPWLSNFFVSPMYINGNEYLTVEHWFQSQKFTDSEVQEMIRLSKTPATAKRLGRQRHPSFRSDWEAIKEEIMLQGLREKFRQHTHLKERLLGTGCAPLEEQAAWDSYWGTGKSGHGKNRMGHLLMKVRDELS